MGKHTSIVHDCQSFTSKELSNFDVSALLGAPFRVILSSGVSESVCSDCGASTALHLEKPTELVAAVAMLRSLHSLKLSGDDIKFLRKALDMKSKELANAISVVPETFSRFENSRQPISESIEKLLRAFVCIRLGKTATGIQIDEEDIFSMSIRAVFDTSRILALHLSFEDCHSSTIGGDCANLDKIEHIRWSSEPLALQA